MARWRFQRTGSWDYPHYGLWGVVTGDVIDSTYAPDGWWSEVAGSTPTTKTVVGPPPTYSEPTDGAVQVWDGDTNKLVFQDPGVVGQVAVTGHLAATDPHGDRADTTSKVAAHAAATDPHGDRADAASKVAAHSAASDPHGDRADAAAKVAAHAAATDPHGDRADAVTKYVAKGSVTINVKDYGATGNGSTDDTVAVQTALDAAKAGGSLVFPPGIYVVSNLTVSYAADSAQPDSGTPYGFQGPKIAGVGKRRAIIQQKTGATGVILAISGKTGTDAGPGHNNKISGLELRDIEIVGVSTGSHGVSLQSVVDCSVTNVMVRNCGGSGVYLARETFVSGVNDEYAYGLNFRNVKAMVNSRYGFECSGTNSISGTFVNCDATSNTLGGYYLAPTNISMYGCLAIANGTGASTRYGLQSVRNSNTASTNNTLLLSGCRFEGNSQAGGYDLRIDAGSGHVIEGCTFFSTSGAHCIGLGLNAAGSSSYVQSPQIVGGYFSGSSNTSQKFLVTGSDCRNLLITNPRLDYALFGTGGNTTPNSLMTDNGAVTSILHNQNVQFNAAGWVEFTRKISTPGAAAANEARMYIKDNGSGKVQLAVKFPSGVEQILATEP